MHTLNKALERLKAGGMVLLLDDESRENEGDLVLAAQFASPETVNFMAAEGRGLICLALAPAEVDRLGLPPMVADNHARRSTAFTVSIEAREGISTGISAADRAHTMRVAADPNSSPHDLASPGHVFPLRAAPGGVLQRNGHTEGAVDLMRLAGLRPAAVICEVMNKDGTMARRAELQGFARAHDLPILTIADIAQYRLATETLVDLVAEASLPVGPDGHRLRALAFRHQIDGGEHLVLVNPGTPEGPALVRVHSECLTGDALGSRRCDCGPQLEESLRRVSATPGAVLVYLKGHEGRGIGLANKIRAYALQDSGLDTVEANRALGLPDDARDYSVAAQVLRHLGRTRVRLLSNNPEKREQLARYGIEVTGLEPLVIGRSSFNAAYLATKAEKFGHVLLNRTPESA